MPADFGGFYQKEIGQRRAILATYLEEEGYGQALETALALPESVANQLIENYVGNYSLPFGLAPTFKINGRDYVVPMAIEEPSVVAAASNGGKRLGNIQSQVLSRQNGPALADFFLIEASKICWHLRSSSRRILPS